MRVEFEQSRYRWVMLLLLWLLYVAFGMVIRSISALISPILRDLQLSYSQMGIILGSWQFTYILVALVGGTIIERWGIRKTVFTGAMIIGLSAALRYFASGFTTLLLAVALFGVGGPMLSIGGPKAISEWFFGRSRGTAVGIYMTGVWIGAGLSLALTNSLVMPLVGHNWRLAFVCYGLFAFAVCILWLVLARDRGSETPTEEAGIIKVFYHLARLRNVQLLLAMALFSFAVGHGISNWLPKILETGGMSASNAGFAASIPIAAAIPAILLIPRVVPQHLRNRSIALLAILTILCLFIVVHGSGRLLYAGLILLGPVSSAFLPLMLLILMDSPEIESKYMGPAGGMFFCVAEIGGFTGPLIMGVLVDVTGAFLAGTICLTCLCLAIAVMTRFLTTPSG